MGDVIQMRPAVRVTSHFGGCPHCGGTDGFLNDGPEHWFTCRAHGMKWCAGVNLFSGWRDEDAQTRRRSRAILRRLRAIQPLPRSADPPGRKTGSGR